MLIEGGDSVREEIMNFLISFILRLLSSIGNLSASQLVAVMLALTLNTRLIMGTVELSTDLKDILSPQLLTGLLMKSNFHVFKEFTMLQKITID